MLPLAAKHNKGRKYTANDWEVVRPEITSLYENATLETVRKIMRERGFDATLKQYKDRIKKWGHKKNVQPDEMEAMVRKKQQRLLQGKRSAFRLRGRPVNPAKIARYEKEHDKHHFGANEGRDIEENMSPADAATPSVISCYTPPDMGPPSPRAAPSPYITTSPQPSFSCRSTHTGSHSSGPYPTLPRSLLVAQATSSFQKQPMPSLLIVKSPTPSYSTTIELDDSTISCQKPAPFFSTSTGQSHDTLQDGAVDIMYLHDYEHVEDTQNSKNETGSKWEARSEYQFPVDEASIEWEVSYGSHVERILSEPLVDSSPSGSLVRSRSQYPDLAMIAPSSIRSRFWSLVHLFFIEFTKKRNRRVLVDRFCSVLSHLIVFKERYRESLRPTSNTIFARKFAGHEYHICAIQCAS